MDFAKVKGIMEQATPITLKQLRGFLGFANFYQRFISNFLEIVKPLTALTKKDTPFLWTDECKQAFNLLKQKFIEEPCLLMPNTLKPFQIETDASLYTTAGVLRQQNTNGDWIPVAFRS